MKMNNGKSEENHVAKRSILILSILLSLIVFSTPIYADTEICIDSIDVNSRFPIIIIDISIAKEQVISMGSVDPHSLQVIEDTNAVEKYSIERLHAEMDRPKLLIVIDSIRLKGSKQIRRFKNLLNDIVRRNSRNADIALYRKCDDNATATFRSSAEEIRNEIDRYDFRNSEPLNNAISNALVTVVKVKSRSKGLLVITNGYRPGGKLDYENIIKLSKKFGIPINFYCMRKCATNKNLARLALVSGGSFEAYTPDHMQIEYLHTNEDISHKYRISYLSKIIPDGRYHNFSIRSLNSGQMMEDTSTVRVGSRVMTLLNVNLVIVILLCIIIILIIALIVFIVIFIRQNRNKQSADTRMLNTPVFSDGPEDEDEGEYSNDGLLPIDDIAQMESDYSRAWLLIKEGINKNKKLFLHRTLSTIGRSSDNDVQLVDPLVSEYHAKIRNVNDVFYLYDLVSETGTYLNHKKLLRPKVLNDWDEIRIGKTVFLFRGVR